MPSTPTLDLPFILHSFCSSYLPFLALSALGYGFYHLTDSSPYALYKYFVFTATSLLFSLVVNFILTLETPCWRPFGLPLQVYQLFGTLISFHSFIHSYISIGCILIKCLTFHTVQAQARKKKNNSKVLMPSQVGSNTETTNLSAEVSKNTH